MNDRIAIYGGAFDPPHNGHIFAITLLLQSGLCDQIWIVPSGDRPDKPKVTAGSLRLEMVEIAFAQMISKHKNILIKDFQVKRGEVGYGTIDLIDFLKAKYPQNEFLFLIGNELLADLGSWKESERLKKELTFLVIERDENEALKAPSGFKIIPLPNPKREFVAISSTELRSLAKAQKDISGMVTPEVARFIRERKIYL